MISDYITIDTLFIIVAILFIIVVIQMILLFNTQKKYVSFMKKIGNGNNIDEMLRTYIRCVEEIKNENEEIKNFCLKMDTDLTTCIQKVGIVRYNAFKDVGSDLSFAIALLDKNNNGVVLNGIYGSESSNIYAKPIKNKKSSYPLSEEEEYAIEIAEQNKNFVTKKRK